jgi:diguanylate cyclase (GGDEF)-like protein
MPYQKSFAAHIFAPLTISKHQLLDILTPFGHSSQSRRQRYALIISRVQLISAIFAFVIPLWIIIDYLVLPDHWYKLAIYRVGCSIIFFTISLQRNLPNNFVTACSLLLTLLLVPPTMYLLTIPILIEVPVTGLEGILRELYSFLPYIVMGGLSIFPLAALEIGILSLPVVAIMFYGNLQIHGADWEAQVSTIWLLLIILGISTFSAMSQLQYMIALVNKASLDPLTGAFTRRTGMETLELQYRMASMHQQPITLAFLDLDDFKSVNDIFGHDQGDKVLQGLATNLRKSLRRGDLLIRWGGEEFLMVLNDTDSDGAHLVLTRMMENGFGQRPDGKPLTASIGLSERSVDECNDWTELVELADFRMYEAKRRGKNRALFNEQRELLGPQLVTQAPSAG